MKRKTRFFRAILSVLVILSMLSSIPVFAGEPENESPYEMASSYMESLKSTIVSAVPDCTWNEQTVIANSYPLFDLDNEINGYVFEFINNDNPCGFMQIDLSTGTARLDSYSFSGVSTATIMKDRLSNNVGDIIYLGGYSYLAKPVVSTLSNKETIIDLYSGEAIHLDSSKIDLMKSDYLGYVNNKMSTANTASTRGINTVTKYVTNYISQSWATGNSVNDTTGMGCAPLAATNICRYWKVSRSKTNLYSNNIATYNALYSAMGTTGQGTSLQSMYSGWGSYISSKGYSKSGASYNTIGWNTVKSLIDGGNPLIFGCNYYISGISAPHAVAVFGYQYIEVENTIIIVDAFSSGVVFKVFSSLSQSSTSTKGSCYYSIS